MVEKYVFERKRAMGVDLRCLRGLGSSPDGHTRWILKKNHDVTLDQNGSGPAKFLDILSLRKSHVTLK